jgi:putative two-component system response regulator
MHDVGKIGVSDTILLKPGKLTAQEFEAMKKHTEIGAKILDGSDVPLLKMAHEIACWHHEKWDGSGYPRCLAGRDIPECARIAAIADVYDALSHNRVYRAALPEDQVLSIMTEGRNKHFDPDLFDCFLKVLEEFREIRRIVAEQSP